MHRRNVPPPLVGVSFALVLAACGSPALEQASPPAAPRPAPTVEELAGATYAGILDQPITLTEGVWEGEPYTEGGAARPRVVLVEEFRLTGNLDGQGGDEAVVLLSSSSGGTGNIGFFAVMGWHGDTLRNIANVELGDRVQVRSARLEGATIVADVVRAGADDAMCCPTEMAHLVWTLDGDRLLPTSAEITGRLSIADLAGTEWVLADLDRGVPAPEQPEVTLTVADGRVTGAGGCNGYFADVTESNPGEIAVGPVGATRMACGPEADDLEQRFLKALGSASRYGFVAGALVITYDRDGAVGTLRFTPRAPAG